MRAWMLFVVTIAPLAVPAACLAQQPFQYQRYQPAGGPVLSPNLQFFRQDPGPLGIGQYLSFVQPQQRLQQAIRQQTGELSQLQSEIHRIGEQSVIAPTGVGGAFSNERPYFQNQNAFFGTRSGAALPRR
jgi:hypothetical protein